MLDELAIEQQKLVTEHKEQLEKLETSFKEDAKSSEDEFKVPLNSFRLPQCTLKCNLLSYESLQSLKEMNEIEEFAL